MRICKSSVFGLCLAAITAVDLNAQPFVDILSVNYQYHLPTEYKESIHDSERNLYIYSADVLLPVSIRKGNYLLAGGQYAHFNFGFRNGTRESETFNVAEFRFGTLYQWKNEKDKTLVLLLPKWSGQGKVLKSSNFQTGGVVLHTHRISSSLAVKAGLYYNREFFGHFFMPLAGIDWEINETLWLYGTLPGNLQLHKVLDPAFAVSLSYLSPSGSLLFENDSDYVRIGKSFPPYAILSIDAHLKLTGPLTFKGSIGHSIWRSYAAYDTDKVQDAEGPYVDYTDGVILKASMIARVFTQ